MKALVFLGLRHTILAKQWESEYALGMRNDTMLYGYGNAATEGFSVEYCSFSRVERIFFKENKIGKIYLYLLKLPILLMKYDVVWTHLDRDALFIARLKGIPLIGRLFCKHIANFVWLIDHTQKFDSNKKKRISKKLGKIDKIFYLSKSEEQEFITHYRVPNDKLLYTRYGINFSAYGPLATGSKPHNFNYRNYILSVGTDEHRDLDLLDIVAGGNPEKKFIVCSGSPAHQLKKFKSNNIVLMRANYNEMVYLYRNCEMVIIPLKFNFHASGITTLLEAAAARKPVIINYTPGLEDYGIDNETCLFVPIGNKEKFNDSINLLWSNSALAEKISNNAYEYLRDEFNTHTYSSIYIENSISLFKK